MKEKSGGEQAMSETACAVSTPHTPRALPLSYGLKDQTGGSRTRDRVGDNEETVIFTTAGLLKSPREQAIAETVPAHPFLLYPLSYSLAAGGS
ncbi:MAG: hypothetical protein QM698_11735 [Micropepsaceae bacterium]